jgi:tetratricopeptide (TPR) repeat protein
MLNDIKNNSANLYLLWDQTMVVMPIEVPVDERVMTQIERVMNGPSASDYFAAAVYYYNTDRDMEQALEWIDQALADNQRYWIMTWKARILGKMENYEQGLSVAQTAMKMAKESDNPDYVKINQDLIAAFKQKM